MLIEHLERRSLLSADPLAGCLCESNIATLSWQGRDLEVVRDSWVMRMPQTNAATARSPLDYMWQHPTAPAGWTLEPFGYGFYGVTAPGASVAEVSAWKQAIGVSSWQPNTISRVGASSPSSPQAFPDTPPNDPRFGELWGLSKIQVGSVWPTTTGSSEIIVGVIDTGIDYRHPDLAANVWVRPAAVPQQIEIGPGASIPIGQFGINTGGNSTAPTDPMDTQGHGTHVAGTIAAVGNNGLGVIGVAPGAKVFAAKAQAGTNPAGRSISTNGAIQAMSVITKLKQEHGQNFVAVNGSYGGPGEQLSTEREAIALLGVAGILFVGAAGNEGSNNDSIPVYPAGYPLANVISVAASNQSDGLADFSNFGATTVAIAAPGEGILSTVPATVNASGYASMSGTSMAAPHVAGVAALIASAFFDADGRLPTFAEMKQAILEGATVIPTVPGVSGLTNPKTKGVVFGNRRLNAFGAIENLLGAEVSVRATRLSGREGDSGTTAVEFRIGLARPARAEPVTVSYTTADGDSDDDAKNAKAGADFEKTSGTVTFQPGEQFKIVKVPVFGDTALEDDETFSFVLTTVVNGRLGRQRSAQYTILNDEAPLVTIRPAIAFEGTGRRTDAIFEVTVNGGAIAPVMVSYATRDGTAVARQDYLPARGMLLFRPGETRKTITVKVIGDRLAEADEVFYLVATARNGTLEEQSVEVSGTIADDDSRVVTVSAVAPGVRGGDAATFRVALERTGGFGDVFPALPPGIELPPLAISARVGTVSQSPGRGLARALGGSDYTTVSKRLTFSRDTLEHVVQVPTASVATPRGFLLQVAGVEGPITASKNGSTGAALIVPDSGGSGLDELTGRTSHRGRTVSSTAWWRGPWRR